MSSVYEPMISDDHIERICKWHKESRRSPLRQGPIETACLGRRLHVPADVFEPTPVGLWRHVLEEVGEADRVLDMGTGSGINGILAASKSSEVVAVDVNPSSIESAKRNAYLNGVATRMRFVVSDLFNDIDGRFDLVLFDPPFKWFKPKNMRERSTSDENYQTLTNFFHEVSRYLNQNARILLLFGTGGDIEYLNHLIDSSGFEKKILDRAERVRDGSLIEYLTYRLEWR